MNPWKFIRAIGINGVKALPLLIVVAFIFIVCLKTSRFSNRQKRIVFVLVPLFPVLFVALGFIVPGIFTFMIDDRHPWYSPYTAPAWITCLMLVSLPNVLLTPLHGVLGSGVANALGLIFSFCWISGLTIFCWRKGKEWYPVDSGSTAP